MIEGRYHLHLHVVQKVKLDATFWEPINNTVHLYLLKLLFLYLGLGLVLNLNQTVVLETTPKVGIDNGCLLRPSTIQLFQVYI